MAVAKRAGVKAAQRPTRVAVPAQAEETLETAEVTAPAAAAPALGSAPAPTPSTGTRVSGATTGSSVGAADLVKYVTPTPAPLVQGLRGNSEVRNNVVRASRGEAAIILFKVSQPGRVHIDIHDRMGKAVALLKDESLDAGQYQLEWAGGADAGGMAPSGIYMVRIQTGSYEDRHKLMLVK